MHILRRAACRFLASPLVQPRWARVSQPPRFPIPRQLPPVVLQSRWNSNEAKSSQGEIEREQDPESERQEPELFTVDPEQIREAAIKGDPIPTQRALDAKLHKNARGDKRDILQKNGFDPKETVYMGNLFFDVTKEDVKAQMAKYGVVEEVNIIYDSRGISKGFGYVQFDSINSARRAISAMHLRIFEGRRCVMYFAQNNLCTPKPNYPASKTLYIGNMAFEMTDRDINELFKDVVNVIDVRLSVDRRTGQPRGFAHAEFVDAESAQAAFEILARKAPYGRKLRVDFSHTNRTAFPVNS